MLCAGMALTTQAVADDVRDKAAAEALFRDGLRLMESGDVAAACPKLAASEEMDPAAGTLLNLASCYEKLGRSASAWVRYDEAIRASQARGRADWEQLARRKAAQLEPALPRVRIVIPPEETELGILVELDGTRVRAAEIGTPISIDPGFHTLTASAPGHATQTLRIEAVPGMTVDAVTPVLTTDAPPPSPVLTLAPTAERGRATRGVGASLLIAGGAALTFGLVAGGLALSDKGGCSPYPACGSTPGGAQANKEAHMWASASTVSFVGAIVLGSAGVLLTLLAPRGPATASLSLHRAASLDTSSLELRW